MPAGRPRLISSPEEFEDMANAYFEEKKANNQPVTITGLALAVGLYGRDQLDEYMKRPEFTDVVKKAKGRVTEAYETRLWESSPTGAIFALKNIASWRDQQDVKHSGDPENPVIQKIVREVIDPSK